jgi:hypothetical protein
VNLFGKISCSFAQLLLESLKLNRAVSLYWLVLWMNVININCRQEMTGTGNKYLFSLRGYIVMLVKRWILLLALGKIATEYLTYISLCSGYW